MHPGVNNAIKLFQDTYKKVPAYNKFIREKNFSANSVKSENDFYNIPVSSKKNYVSKYPIFDRFPGNKVPPIIYASSGSSGTPTFWFNNDEHENLSGLEHEILYNEVLKINKKEPTLIIICFAMGLWIAGPHSVASNRVVARKGFNLSVAAPGYLVEDVLSVIKSLGKHYKNIVFFGHPPRLMDIMHQVTEEKLFNPNQNIKLIASGDKVTEAWRDSICKLLNIKDRYHSVVGLYGSTDAGAMAYETPLSIFIKRKTIDNPQLKIDLFGENAIEPAFYQYNQNNIFFEHVNEHLVITSDTALPLIRYNILDLGKVLTYNQVLEILKKHNLTREAKKFGLTRWQRPFITVKGRSDVATRFYALAIYPEHIHTAIKKKNISRLLTGNYFVNTKSINQEKTQELHIYFELSTKIKKDSLLIKKIEKEITRTLIDLSLEYRKLFNTLGQKAKPKIHLSVFGKQFFYPTNQKGMLYLSGKKAKMV